MPWLWDELRRADVGDEQSVGRMLAGDGIAAHHLGIDDGRSLAAHTQRQPVLFCCSCQVAIDGCDIGMTACERRDEDRIAQTMTEKCYCRINLVQVDLRQSLVYKAYIVPTRPLRCGNTLLK